MYDAGNMYHVTNMRESSSGHHDNWNRIEVSQARYETFHGNLLLGLPVAGFTIAPQPRKSIFPFQGNVKERYYRVQVPFNPTSYHIYNMNDHLSAPNQEHYLCISKGDDNDEDDDDKRRKKNICWLLQDKAINNIDIFLENYEGKHKLEQRNTGTINVYFIEDVNVPVEPENWDTVEKEVYDYGRAEDRNPNVNQLLDDWIRRQREIVVQEVFEYISIHFL